MGKSCARISTPLRWRGNQNLAQLIEIVAEVGGITDGDGIALAPFHVFSDVVAAYP